MDDLDAGVVNHGPSQHSGRPAEGDLLVVEEEVVVHAAEDLEQPRVEEDTGPGDPVDRPRASPPNGLVFPPRARYQLLPRRPGQGREGTHGGLPAPIRVPEVE